MAAIDPIKITGLAEFDRNLRALNADLPKVLRQAQNAGAQVVVDWASPKVPRQSGRAVRTLRATSTRTSSKVTFGGARAPYAPWLDFGGRVGPARSIVRAWDPGGRYVYAGYAANVKKVHGVLIESLVMVAAQAGLEVDQ